MNEITIFDKKKNLLNLMEIIHQYCNTNNIIYFLYYGSLIGAIRHNGFIPWDDDIDIAMPRPDYEKFIQMFNNDDIELSNYTNQQKMATPFTKVFFTNTYATDLDGNKLNYGLGIDIFPLDGIPVNKIRNSFFYIHQHLLVKIFSKLRACEFNSKYDSLIKSLLSKIIKNTILKITNSVYFAKLIDKNSKRFSFSTAKQVGCNVGFFEYKKKEFSDKSNYSTVILHKFENKEYYVPIGYDSVLKSIYGNYMELPPIEKRNAPHNENFYYVK